MILTLIIAFLSLVALMIVHEFGHFIIAKKFGVRVDEFGIGYPPRIFGMKFGETIYSINWLPLGAFVRIYGEDLPAQAGGGVDDYRSFIGQAIWKRVLIVLGGVVAFWLASIILFSVVFLIGADLPLGNQDIPQVTNARVQIFAVNNDSPASTAGIKPGDIIISLQAGDKNVVVKKVVDFQNFTKENVAKEITAQIKRSGQIIEVKFTPRENPPAGQGSVGVNLERVGTLIQKSSWYMAPINGTVFCWNTTVSALGDLWKMLSGLFVGKGAPAGAEFAGPLGITVFLAQAASLGVGFFLFFIGSISVFIAIFNLFPIPALDGGKLVFLVIEKVIKKPVPVKVEQTITAVFFFILIAMSLFITFKFDIPRFAEFWRSSLNK